MSTTFTPEQFTFPELLGETVLESVDPRTLTPGQLAQLIEQAAFVIVRILGDDDSLSLECSDSLTPYPPPPPGSPPSSPPWARTRR